MVDDERWLRTSEIKFKRFSHIFFFSFFVRFQLQIEWNQLVNMVSDYRRALDSPVRFLALSRLLLLFSFPLPQSKLHRNKYSTDDLFVSALSDLINCIAFCIQPISQPVSMPRPGLAWTGLATHTDSKLTCVVCCVNELVSENSQPIFVLHFARSHRDRQSHTTTKQHTARTPHKISILE